MRACPHCGDPILDRASVCPRCRTWLTPEGSPPARTGSFLGWIAGILVLVTIAALLVPAISRAINRAKATACMSNLSQLDKMQHLYVHQFGGRTRCVDKTGGAFWLELTKTSPPLLDASCHDLLLCPLLCKESSPGRTSYRGPAEDISLRWRARELGDRVIGACDHVEDTMILLMGAGDITEARHADPLYEQGLRETRP